MKTYYALGIAEKSPQRPFLGARTCNEKPDPCGNAKILF